MSKVITYKNAGASGCFCQIKLDSGERVLVGIARTGIRISKLGWGGFIPTKTIANWSISEVPIAIQIFADHEAPQKHPLDAIKDGLLRCRSIAEIEHLCGCSDTFNS